MGSFHSTPPKGAGPEALLPGDGLIGEQGRGGIGWVDPSVQVARAF